MGLLSFLLPGAEATAATAAPKATAAAPAGLLQTGLRDYQRGYLRQAIPKFRAACKSDASAMSCLWLGRALSRQGGPANLEEATQAFRQVLAKQPNNVEALTSLGELLSWRPTSRPEAADLLRQAHQLAPDNTRVLARLSETLAWLGRVQEARPLADKVAEAQKKQPEANQAWLATYAGVLATTGNAPQAVDLYELLLRTPGVQADTRMKTAYALALVKAKQPQQASQHYPAIKTAVMGLKNGQNPELRAAVAGLAYELGFFDDVLTLDTDLPQHWKDNLVIRLRAARAMAKAKRPADAIAAFYALYKEGLLTPEQKVEYADYLIGLDLPEASLPAPNLPEVLYREAFQGMPKGSVSAARVQLKLARWMSHEDARYAEAVTAFREALARLHADPKARQEYLDWLKSDRKHPEETEAEFKRLLSAWGNDVATRRSVEAVYAEYLSYQESRRSEAIRLYAHLLDSDTARFEKPTSQVLQWHRPSRELIPVYEQILAKLPDNKAAQVSLARAQAQVPGQYDAAVKKLQALKTQYPDDADLQREWLGLLTSQPGRHRRQALATLRTLSSQNPDDLALQLQYARVLSYEHQLTAALRQFNVILARHPENKEALVGKAYTLLWGNQPLAAKAILNEAQARYPKDAEVSLALAQTEKALGRMDKALNILEQMRYAPRGVNQLNALPEDDSPTAPAAFILAAGNGRPTNAPLTWDVSPLPPPSTTRPQAVSAGDGVDTSLAQLRQARAQAEAALNQPGQAAALDALHTVRPQTVDTRPNNNYDVLPSAGLFSMPWAAQATLDRENPTSSALLPSGLRPEQEKELENFERNLNRELRPTLQAGYEFLAQDGEPTTNRLGGYGYPNQLSLSITPTFRLRGGVSPRRFFIPRRDIGPTATWATQYNVGANWRLADRLTWDGDISLVNFSQSDATELLYQTYLRYTPSDKIRVRVGSRRDLLANSLLSIAGLKPDAGFWRGRQVGPALETAFFGELTLLPMRGWDISGAYEFGLVDGNNLPSNTKNQIYATTGWTWPVGQTHSARLGYEFLWFAYRQNATAGFIDPTTGQSGAFISLSPLTAAPRGTVLGGYFSPDDFYLNAIRLDISGSFWNKRMEYRLGGSLGVQAFSNGAVPLSSPTTLASTFDANLVYNWTDWLASYGHVNFIDSGGFFQRWRFGGGFILRPNIPALSPLIGQK
jgi:predicted Zn-dependent protease